MDTCHSATDHFELLGDAQTGACDVHPINCREALPEGQSPPADPNKNLRSGCLLTFRPVPWACPTVIVE